MNDYREKELDLVANAIKSLNEKSNKNEDIKLKTIYLIISCVFLLIAALSIPIGVGFGIYDAAINDAEIKLALWFGFKVWACAMFSGLFVGVPLHIYGVKQ